MPQAKGNFKVDLKPQAPSYGDGDVKLARLTIDKQFSGDLEGSSYGEMLSARTAVKDSAGYVAIEKVTGTLQGRKGSFVLQHSSTMTRGKAQQSITVVPDSGTGDLEGLSGSLTIIIENGQHFYDFNYCFEE
ncbi:MAG: DUF3224 domain-containing protein [Trueperaceae bacterium]|nr:DUF3224 domain-containing protein [Trueperaceae bacterium]